MILQAPGAWTVTINKKEIASGSQSGHFEWDGTVDKKALPEGTYELILTRLDTQETQKVKVVIDNTRPVISNLGFAPAQGEKTGNVFTVSSDVQDVGQAGLDLEKLSVKIKGTTLADSPNPFLPKAAKFSKNVTIQPQPGQVITADVTVEDRAGNQTIQNSASDKLDRMIGLTQEFESTQLALAHQLADTCPATANAYHIASLNDSSVDLTAIRDAEAYAAANLVLDPTASPKDRAAAFVYYATLMNIPTSSDEVLLMVAGYGVGRIVVKGGVIILSSVKDLLPTLNGRAFCLINDEGGYLSFNFSKFGTRIGNLSFERGIRYTKPGATQGRLTDQEREGIVYLLKQGQDVIVRRRDQINKSADFFVDGVSAELKSVAKKSAGPNLIKYLREDVIECAKQGAEIAIFDARGSAAITKETFYQVLEEVRRESHRLRGLQKLRFFGDGYDETVTLVP